MKVLLAMQSANGIKRTFPVHKSSNVIGSEIGVDIRVPILSVSPKHCKLSITNRWVKATDLKSESGTLVNGEPIDSTLLKHGDHLTVGSVTFEVQMEDAEFGESNPLPEIHVEPRGIGHAVDESHVTSK